MASKKETDKQFSRYDANHDGTLTEAEFVAGETDDVEETLKNYPNLGGNYRTESFAWAHKRYAEAAKDKNGLMTQEGFNPRARQKCAAPGS